ncbi:MAG: hypothetical protein IJP09_02375 [Clostridia bacterium]|nr:hypothetical protein [Clostridia bacterium]
MIWRRLKKSTPEQEKEFKENLEKENVGIKDFVALLVSAFFVLILPCILILGGIGLLLLWAFGAL